MLTRERRVAAPARGVVLVQNRHLVGSARVTLNFHYVKSKPPVCKDTLLHDWILGENILSVNRLFRRKDSSGAALPAEQRAAARGLRRGHCKVFVFLNKKQETEKTDY